MPACSTTPQRSSYKNAPCETPRLACFWTQGAKSQQARETRMCGASVSESEFGTNEQAAEPVGASGGLGCPEPERAELLMCSKSESSTRTRACQSAEGAKDFTGRRGTTHPNELGRTKVREKFIEIFS